METTQFNTHPLWARPEQITSLLAELEPAPTESALSAFERLRYLAAQLETYRGVDPRLFVADQLRIADEHWQNAINSLVNYRSNPGGGYDGQAVMYAESWLQAAGGWHRPSTSSSSLAKQAKAEYQAIVDSYRVANEELRAQLHEQRREAESRRLELENIIKTLEASISGAQATLVDLETTMKADKRVLEDAVTKHDEIFRSGQTDRTNAFNEWLRQRSADFAELAEPHLVQIRENATEGTDILDHIRSLGDQTDAAAGQTTGHILAEEFKKSSKDERDAGDWSFWAGVAVSLVGVGWLVFVALATFGERADFNWNWVSLKIALAVALGGVAAVLIRRGQHSQTAARDYKRTELELRAIGPFLSDIRTQTVAEKAKVDFLERTFGRRPDGEDRTKVEDSGQILGGKALDVLSAVAEKLPALKI